MKQTIVVASNNAGKISEIKNIFSEYNVFSLKDKNIQIEVDEDEDTFEKNALKKAKTLSNITKTITIADDTGLCIDYLNGAPGIKTARWMEGTDRQRNLSLLEKLKDIPKEKRTAKIVTAIAFSYNGKEIVKTHIMEGYISFKLKGDNGFGFDEIFELEDGRTLAEMSNEEKNEISPRKKFLEKIKKYIQNEIL